jgi:hypothetical protein
VGVALAANASAREFVMERRVYTRGSVLPPDQLLRRNGLNATRIESAEGTIYQFRFASLEARAKAWDRFNADPQWCVLRDSGSVRMSELSVAPRTRRA